jgi:predicted phage baseplate assembly protein
VTLPAPNLDDRRFQDLVDDARRYVQRRCPQWSDHNVSDPGITLIETFAMVTDQLLYRLNRVPDRLYLRFLELLGIDVVPPVAARADVTFWLTAPRDDTVTVRACT